MIIPIVARQIQSQKKTINSANRKSRGSNIIGERKQRQSTLADGSDLGNFRKKSNPFKNLVQRNQEADRRKSSFFEMKKRISDFEGIPVLTKQHAIYPVPSREGRASEYNEDKSGFYSIMGTQGNKQTEIPLNIEQHPNDISATPVLSNFEKSNRKSLTNNRFMHLPANSKKRAIIALWKSAIRKALILSRVFYILNLILEEAKLFGLTSKNGKHLEDNTKHRERKSEIFCIIFPDSSFALLWSLVMIILLLFTAVYVPFRIAYLEEIDTTLTIIEYVVDAFFFIDILINFFTAYYNSNNELVTDKFMIAKRYLRTWFLIDLIGCIPIQLFYNDSSSARYGKSARLLRLPRLWKLFKMFRIAKLLNVMQDNWIVEQIVFKMEMNAGIIRLLKGLLFMFFFVHIFACAWFWWAKEWNYLPDSWVVRYGMRNEAPQFQYLLALYWVMQTTTTVGYGDINAVTNGERTFALVLMVFGVGFYSYTVGNFTSLFTNEDSKNSKLKKKLHALNEFAHSSKLPQHLYFRIKRILKRNNETQYEFSSFDDGGILEELPASLRSEVITFTHKNIVDNVSFFRDKDPNFIVDILPKFRHINLEREEILFSEGNYAEEVYFLVRGRIHLINQEGYVFRTYIQGSYLGEIEILSKPEFRSCSAIAAMDTEILAIRRVEFNDIINDYPEIKDELLKVVEIRKYFHRQAEKYAKITNLKLAHGAWERIKSTAVGSIYNIKTIQDDTTNSQLQSECGNLTPLPLNSKLRKTTKNVVLETGFLSMKGKSTQLDFTTEFANDSAKQHTSSEDSSSSESSEASSRTQIEERKRSDEVSGKEVEITVPRKIKITPKPTKKEGTETKGESVSAKKKHLSPNIKINDHLESSRGSRNELFIFPPNSSPKVISDDSMIGIQNKAIKGKNEGFENKYYNYAGKDSFLIDKKKNIVEEIPFDESPTNRIEANIVHIKKLLDHSKRNTDRTITKHNQLDTDIYERGSLSNRNDIKYTSKELSKFSPSIKQQYISKEMYKDIRQQSPARHPPDKYSKTKTKILDRMNSLQFIPDQDNNLTENIYHPSWDAN